MTKSTVRIATTSGLLRKFADFDDYANQIERHVRYASDFKADCIVFPEFVTAGLGIIKKDWTVWRHEMLRISQELSAKHKIWICTGSMLHLEQGKWRNTASLVSPEGGTFHQQKIHPTPFERQVWKMKVHPEISLIDTPFGKVSMAVCYDIEFPEAIRAAAEGGAEIILNPSWTDDEPGFWRVRQCAAARCIENSVFVAQAPLVGGIAEIPGFEFGMGKASVLTPCDTNFPPKGIAAEGPWCLEQTVVAEVNLAALRTSRKEGSVTPLADRHHGSYVIKS